MCVAFDLKLGGSEGASNQPLDGIMNGVGEYLTVPYRSRLVRQGFPEESARTFSWLTVILRVRSKRMTEATKL